MLRRTQIADPWYTEDFDTAFLEIYRGCQKHSWLNTFNPAIVLIQDALSI